MNRFENIIYKIINILTVVGGIFMAICMLIIVANIVVRLFGRVIPGSYEIIELVVVIAIAFSLSFTGKKKGHVNVDILLKRVPLKLQAVLNAINNLLSMIFWGALSYAAFKMAFDKGWMEISELHRIPFLPFRFVFGIGLLLLAIVFLVQAFNSLITRKQ
ncbi:MAG: TRAP transporter small permease [Deltaproteobacteria bacterium]|nr:TRAP transporter small permease [Deltaproteobacteria bacterium]